MSNGEPDHYIWEGYYLRGQYDHVSDRIRTTTREECQRRIAEDAGVENSGWEENNLADYSLFQLHDTEHHVVTVVRRPVYGDSDDS